MRVLEISLLSALTAIGNQSWDCPGSGTDNQLIVGLSPQTAMSLKQDLELSSRAHIC